MNYFLLLLKIFLPPIFCALIISTVSMSLEYYPLSFGIIIGLSNWDRYKIHPLLGVLFCLILSYLAFFGGYFSIYITNIVFQSYGELGKILSLLTSTTVIAPVLIIVLFKFIFRINKTSFTWVVILISIIFLTLQFYIALTYGDKATSIDLIDNKILHPFTMWQIVIALAIQLIINQNNFLKIKK